MANENGFKGSAADAMMAFHELHDKLTEYELRLVWQHLTGLVSHPRFTEAWRGDPKTEMTKILNMSFRD